MARWGPPWHAIESEQQSTAAARAPSPTRSAAHVRRWVRRARQSLAPAWVRDILALFVASRLAFVAITYVGYVLIVAPKYSTSSVGVRALASSWDRWDAVNYLAIASHGYANANMTAFFPLYPLLIRLLTSPFQGHGVYALGLIVSNVAYLGAMLLLYVLARDRWDATVAARTVLLLTLFPTAFYTFAPYNESLLLLFSIGCFVALRRRCWALAGALGGLAVLARAAGLLLVIPYVYTWLESLALAPEVIAARALASVRRRATGAHGGHALAGNAAAWLGALLPGDRAGWAPLAPVRNVMAHAGSAPSWGGAWHTWARARAIAWVLVIPAALGAYALYCALAFGDPLAFAHAQAHWNRVYTWPWVDLWWQLVGLWQAAPASFFQAHDALDLAATLLFAGLLVAGWRQLPVGQTLYFAALLLLAVVVPGGVASHLRDPMTSNARFVLEMFPGFIMLARLARGHARWEQGILLVATSLLATLAIIFVLGRWLV